LVKGGRSEARELAAAVEAGQAAMALGACALEHSERERSEGEKMGEGERAPARSPQLCEAGATSGGAMEYGGHALGVFCPRHPCCFEWKYEGERDECLQ
jgi:hypothetical protein